MIENVVSINMDEAKQNRIKDALEVLKVELLPILISLSSKDRLSKVKVNDKSLPFVEKALAYAEKYPNMLPPSMNIPELKTDLESMKLLRNFLVTTKQISQGLEDTAMQAGSEAMQMALLLYGQFKQSAALGLVGAKGAVEDMGKRFQSPQKGSEDNDENSNG